MNYIITATQSSIEDVIQSFRGHVNIVAITQEEDYVKYIKELSHQYMHIKDGVERPVASLKWIQEGLLPKLSLAYAKGIGFVRKIDDITNVDKLVPLEHEDYIQEYASDILTNPVTKTKIYLLADQVYNGDKPVVFTCTEEEESDLAILETIARVYNDWFKIYPTNLYELNDKREILKMAPHPAYKSEVDNFVQMYKEMEAEKVNLK